MHQILHSNSQMTDIQMIMSYKSRINKVFDEKTDLKDIDSTDILVLSEIKTEENDLVHIGISHRKELKNGEPKFN